jgi:replicative DNA helicase
MYGGLRPGELYAWVSRPKHGKSTILSHIASKATIINPKVSALILDTEMQTEVIKFRIASSITGIPMWYLETGNFRKNKELLAKWNSKKSELSQVQGRVKHLQVSGKPISEIESIIQRWYLGQVGRGNPAVIVYDYIKLTGEADKNKQEYQMIGDKVDRLKELSVRINVPILTACQLNRSAENGVDDSSAISQSDRLQWFAAYVGIFRRKTLEEQAEDGAQFGTHKMIELASRYQGQHAHGHSDLVRVMVNNRVEYRKNFISFNVENFNVEERGTLQNIIDHQNGVDVNIFDRDRQENQQEQLL